MSCSDRKERKVLYRTLERRHDRVDRQVRAVPAKTSELKSVKNRGNAWQQENGAASHPSTFSASESICLLLLGNRPGCASSRWRPLHSSGCGWCRATAACNTALPWSWYPRSTCRMLGKDALRRGQRLGSLIQHAGVGQAPEAGEDASSTTESPRIAATGKRQSNPAGSPHRDRRPITEEPRSPVTLLADLEQAGRRHEAVAPGKAHSSDEHE